MFVNAATGSSKNMTPNREKTPPWNRVQRHGSAHLPRGTGRGAAATLTSQPVPASVRRYRPRLQRRRGRLPSERQPGWPQPQPMSSARASALSASVPITWPPSGASIASISALCVTHVAPTSPFQKAICSAFFTTTSFLGAGSAPMATVCRLKVQGIAAGRHAGDVMKGFDPEGCDDFTFQIVLPPQNWLLGCGLKQR